MKQSVIKLQRGQLQSAVSDDLLPLSTAHSDYVSAIERIAARVATLSVEFGLYRFGNVGCPGISDLDFLCVVPNGTHRKLLRCVEKILVEEPLATHGPFITEERRMFDLPVIFPGIQVNHISGPDRFGEAFNLQEQGDLYAYSIADIIEAGCRRWVTLSSYCTRPNMGARKALLTLWSLTHLLKSCARAEISIDQRHSGFRDDVFEMRNIVAGTGKACPERLRDLAQRGAVLVADIVSTAAKLAAEVQRDEVSLAPYVLAGRALLLHSSNDELSTEAIYLRIGRRFRRYEVLKLPGHVYAHFSRCTFTPSKNAPLFDHAVARRTAAATAYRNFLKRAGCHFAAIPPSPFIPSRSFASKPLDQLVLRWIAGRERTSVARLAT